MNNYSGSEIVNIGTGEDLSIKELAEIVRSVVKFQGKIVWDTEKPNGTPRKLLNVDKIHGLGWRNRISLDDGIRETYKWFLENDAIIKK